MMTTSNTGGRAKVVGAGGDVQQFNGVKIFSATMAPDREGLGDKITNWVAQRPHLKIIDVVVSQSSDEAFHCLAITVFFWENV